MSKVINADFQEYIRTRKALDLATCWLITRRDGVNFGFTDFPRDLEIAGIVYKAKNSYTRTSIRDTSNLAVDNLDVESVFSDDGITESDIRAGRFDFADVRVFVVKYSDLTVGSIKMRRGKLGEVGIKYDRYNAELRGLSQLVSMVVGETYTANCLADLGDSRCRVDVAALTVECTVTAVHSEWSFTVSGADIPAGKEATYWNGGLTVFQDGQNSGVPMECRVYDPTTQKLDLFLPMPFPVQVGQKFKLQPGCDKLENTCIGKYNNILNFRGFPHVPGQDAMNKAPDSPN